MKVAALYVDPNGVYAGVDGVEVWDEARDARLYAGPWPVVAHPPCNRWSKPLALVNQTRYGLMIGDDGGCFKAALDAVRRWGGVLEHPAHSWAWDHFELPKPLRGCWSQSLWGDGYATVVDQWAYGHPCEKRTWLYYIGHEPPVLDWRRAPGGLPLISLLYGAQWYRDNGRTVVRHAEASATPIAFRDELLAMARGARLEEATCA